MQYISQASIYVKPYTSHSGLTSWENGHRQSEQSVGEPGVDAIEKCSSERSMEHTPEKRFISTNNLQVKTENYTEKTCLILLS